MIKKQTKISHKKTFVSTTSLVIPHSFSVVSINGFNGSFQSALSYIFIVKLSGFDVVREVAAKARNSLPGPPPLQKLEKDKDKNTPKNKKDKDKNKQ